MKTIITATFILPTLYWLGLSTFAADSGNRLTPSTGLVSEALQSLNAAVKNSSQEQATVEALAESVAMVIEKLQPSPVSEQLAHLYTEPKSPWPLNSRHKSHISELSCL